MSDGLEEKDLARVSFHRDAAFNLLQMQMQDKPNLGALHAVYATLGVAIMEMIDIKDLRTEFVHKHTMAMCAVQKRLNKLRDTILGENL